MKTRRFSNEVVLKKKKKKVRKTNEMLWSELNNINNLNAALHFQAKSKHQPSLKVC